MTFVSILFIIYMSYNIIYISNLSIYLFHNHNHNYILILIVLIIVLYFSLEYIECSIECDNDRHDDLILAI